jgi:biopolymer transport protein ExbB
MKALRALSFVLTLGLGMPLAAHAWWNKDFSQRTKVTLNTSAAGVETKEALTGAVVPVRLHSGNFDFLKAKPDGTDLRVVAADDKTPLKFTVERFDGANEMAVLWVQVPSVAPGSDKNTVFVYAGNEAAAAEPAGPLFDSATLADFHFGEKDGLALDHTGALKSTTAAGIEPNGQIGASAKLAGAALSWPASDKLKFGNAGPLSVAMWIKPAQAGGTLYAQGPLSIVLDGAKVSVKWGTLQLAGGDVPAAAWAHVAFAAGAGKATLYVNGAQAVQADLPAGLPAVEGAVNVGNDYTGLVDELNIASSARSADWMKFAFAVQSADAKLVASVTQGPDSADEEGGDAGYMTILIKNLTPDAKAVIAILTVMFVIAVYVMITKSIFVGRADKANRAFLESFREAKDVLTIKGDQFGHSSLARLYEAGLRELVKRDVGQNNVKISGASMDAVKASVDADMVRENHHLNSKMVLLTIAIAGGPFLGLLGTVVGVMITFAAIAAAGDVNVNAIAPGIAAALLATVAGLAVAIPALFGYNYLAARIKNISSDMQIFVDEFVTRVAEVYGAR